MEFLQLEYFCDAAVSENFSHTAKKYNVPTSNISQTVKRLESELGVSLFNRTSNKITLTEQGRVFYEGISRALSEISRVKNEIQADGGTLFGEIKILINTNRRLVIRAIEKFRAMFPNVSIIINHSAKAGVEYDIIVSSGTHMKGEYDVIPLSKERMMLACKKGAYPEGIYTLSDFRGERFISMSDSFQLYGQTLDMCQAEGFLPNVVIQADDPYYVRRYVEMGLGVAIVPTLSWRGQFSDGISLIDIGDWERRTALYIPRMRKTPPAVDALVKIIREVFIKESENTLA